MTRARVGYGRQAKRGRVAGFLRWLKLGEREKNFAKEIAQRGGNRSGKGRKIGEKGLGSGRFRPP